MRDRDTGRSRGFGYVNFSTNDEAEAAITGMNDQVWMAPFMICIGYVSLYGQTYVIALVLNFQELDGRRVKVSLADATQTTQGGSGPSGDGGYV